MHPWLAACKSPSDKCPTPVNSPAKEATTANKPLATAAFASYKEAEQSPEDEGAPFCCQIQADAYYTEGPECPESEPPAVSCAYPECQEPPACDVYPECPEPPVYPECSETPSSGSGSHLHGSPKRFAYALAKPMLLVNPRWMRAPSGPEDKSRGGGEGGSATAVEGCDAARTYSVATTTMVLTQMASPQPRPPRSWSCPSLLVSRQQAEESAAGAASSVLCQCVGFCCCVARGTVPYSIGSY